MNIEEIKFKTAWYTFMTRMNDKYLDSPEQTLVLVMTMDKILEKAKDKL